MIKHCKQCGKLFETNYPNKLFCDHRCRNKYYYILDQLKLEEEARKAEEARKQKPIFIVPVGYRLWDPKDPECIETMAYIRTIKPIDFSGLNAEIEDELRKKANAVHQGHYKTLSELRSGF